MTIDKQLVPTKVCFPFIHCIATKFGFNFSIVTDLGTKYFCNAKDSSCQRAKRLVDIVVMCLMEPYLDDERNVTMDNFLISLLLSHRLLQNNTTLPGTVNKVRCELPPLANDTAEHEEFSTSVLRSGTVSLTIYTPKKKKTVCKFLP